jgi:hypothetical protein
MTDDYRGIEHGQTVTLFSKQDKSRTCHLGKFSVFLSDSLMCWRAVLMIQIAIDIRLEVEII